MMISICDTQNKKQKNPKMPSSAEAIMICFDTSVWMDNNKSSRFKQQADAIRYYFTQKINSNPQTVVGLTGMGKGCIKKLITPTRDIDLIMESLNDANISGDSLMVGVVVDSHDVWFYYRDVGERLPKRIAVFAGGPLYYEKDIMEELGQGMKEHNVACDAIIFGAAARDHKELFDTLIAAADNNGNCNLFHVPPESTVLSTLLRSLNVGASCCQQESSSVADLDLSRLSLDLKLDNANQNREQDIIYPNWETLDEKTGTWKLLDDANPNWETFDEKTAGWELDNDQKTGTWSQLRLDNAAETLDQKIEKAQRELDSLIQQKNQQVAC